ncbi:E3 ubiquitin-protein ligase RNF4-like [Sinocyclocheilus grahami]|uniref:E3 ubiquitin-protein ligase RNF4-like n=1 Tax=Sinocyclocheilus grahami TaxID=75366 RepID=UPI0007ACF31F|nr:PREDICTED: E3 ubiquitin-protein ligase RNF4-like [Sinocyclocheilus grahami]
MSTATQRKRRTSSATCSRRGNSKRNRTLMSQTARETIDVLESDRTRSEFEHVDLPAVSFASDSAVRRSTPGAVSCPVCMDAYSEIIDSGRLMVSTKCGHLFCSQCIRDSLSRAHSCPTCRKKLTHKQYHPIYI